MPPVRAQILATCFDDIACGAMTAAQQLQRRARGLSVLKQDAVIDAKSVLDSVIGDPVKTPNDKQLLLHALAFREHLEDGSVDRLYWFDTRAMLADGMNKCSVDREALVTACERGEWHLVGDEPVRAQKFHGGDSSPAELSGNSGTSKVLGGDLSPAGPRGK